MKIKSLSTSDPFFWMKTITFGGAKTQQGQPSAYIYTTVKPHKYVRVCGNPQC